MVSDIAAIIGSFVAVVSGFLAVDKIMLSQASRDREADREERKQLSQAIERMATASERGHDRVAKAVERQADESKERNGHLGELIVQQGEMAKELTDSAVSKIVSSVKVQHVDKQEVEHQHVKEAV